MKTVLAIDIGTSRVKVATVDFSGRIIELYDQRIHRSSNADSQDAEEWWIACYELIRRIEDKNEIAAIAVTGNMHALLAVDEAGAPLFPASLWSDTSAESESNYLNDKYADKLLESFGNYSIPGFTLPKLLKLKRERAELYGRIHKLLQPKDLITLRLTGNIATDPVDASGTFMMNIESGEWDGKTLAEEGIRKEILPEIRQCHETVGTITRQASELTKLPVGLPVIIGAGDLATALLGSGGDDRTYSLTLGTSGQLMRVSDTIPESVKGGVFVFPYVERGKYFLLGSIPAGGLSFEWLAHKFKLSMSEFFAAASEDGLPDNFPIYLPYLLGSGSPVMDYSSNGAFLKISAEHSTGHLCASAIAGVVSSLKHSMDAMEEELSPLPAISVQALAARQPEVSKAVRYIFDRDLVRCQETEASLIGTAILGVVGAGVYPTISDARGKMLKHSPVNVDSVNNGQLYRQYYDVYRQFSDRLLK